MNSANHGSISVKADNMIAAIKAYELDNPIHVVYQIAEEQ